MPDVAQISAVNLNPFTDIVARDWLAASLWKEESPDSNTEYLLLGDGPFAATELADFLRRNEISILFDKEEVDEEEESQAAIWECVLLPSPPCVVFGWENVLDTSEYQSLTSDLACGEKP